MKKERAITVIKDEQGNILEIRTNKGHTYNNLETAIEFLDQASIQTIKSTKKS